MNKIKLYVSPNSKNQHLKADTGKTRIEMCGDIENIYVVIKSSNKKIKVSSKDSRFTREYYRDHGYCIEREDIDGVY